MRFNSPMGVIFGKCASAKMETPLIRIASMKPIVNRLGKRIWWRAACAVFLLGAMTAALPAQTLTTLHRFGSADCGYPGTALVQAINGRLYGTTTGGGATNSGTIFEIAPGGAPSTLYSFCPNGGGVSCWTAMPDRLPWFKPQMAAFTEQHPLG
jgi:uncharacterized repeat protein (TIGR03803 family)